MRGKSGHKTKLQTAAIGVLLAYDNYINPGSDGDDRELVIALTVLRDALPKAQLAQVDRIISRRTPEMDIGGLHHD